MANKKVFIAVGHGGKDPGAVANNLKESNINLNISLSTRDILRSHGVDVLLSRESDVDDSMDQEIAEAKAYKPDIAIAFHINAGEGDGFEAFYSAKNNSSASKALAGCIENRVKMFGQNSRGLKTKLTTSGTDWYGFIRNLAPYFPAIITEGAFIDNKTDISIIDTLEEQQALGVAYARGILDFFGIEYKTNGEDYRKAYHDTLLELTVLQNKLKEIDRIIKE